jgi:sulfhydrogenase subunit alpha
VAAPGKVLGRVRGRHAGERRGLGAIVVSQRSAKVEKDVLSQAGMLFLHRVVHEVDLDIFEGSRYYEALLKGRHFLEVQGIICRVCAICSASHTVAALTAIEKALGVDEKQRAEPDFAEATYRTFLLRGLLVNEGGLLLMLLNVPEPMRPTL